ncbi:MAG: transcription-repair coupling factor [Ruminococcaceae bacterium]|nr:transcription-repair coupling factor [Oscillospiraceae bacterium]
MTHMAASLRRATGRRILLITPDEFDARRVLQDLTALSDEEPILLLPREFTFHSVETASREWETARLRAFDEMQRGCGIVVASIDALIERTMPPEYLAAHSFDLHVGEEYRLDELSARLIAAGYERTSRVEGCGQFAVRGGILDVFSPAADLPVRVDFFGDEVDSIGYFDPGTQRRTDDAASARIIPAVETVPAAAEGGIPGLLKTLREIISVSLRRKNGRELEKTITADLERLQNEGIFPAADRYLPLIYPMATGLSYLDPEVLVLPMETGRIRERVKNYWGELSEDLKTLMEEGVLSARQTEFAASWEEYVKGIEGHPVVLFETFIGSGLEPKPREILTLSAKQLPSYGGSMETALSDIRHYLREQYTVYVLASGEQRARNLQEHLLKEDIHAELDYSAMQPDRGPGVIIACGALSSGMEYPGIRFAVLTEGQILAQRRTQRKAKPKSARNRIQSYADLHPGDLVVHDLHGIGRFVGIEKIKTDHVERDYIKLQYSGTDVLFIPATQLDMVSKYIGAAGEDAPVKLNKLSGTDWHKAKSRAKSAAKDMAKRLIALYAARTRLPGYAFPKDDPWQAQFEEAFEYQETDDQLRCAEEIKRDMEKSYPMDRLLCGDVGFGKTEVALRAVMKCVMAGKQAALLVPTTVLARQHYMTVLRRFAEYPVKIALLSRFQNTNQTREIMNRCADGRVDIIVGTHKLLNKDMRFRDLGLLIIDEEQRFGVSQKERLRELAKGVDTLTMTATPIPRTLNMALSGVRDMSTLEEAPRDRQPVQTYVLEYDASVIADAIRREVARGGQVFYMHNRVETIDVTAGRLRRMLPDIQIDIGHGQMSETELNAVMKRMTDGETQVLVCTTIIESGIDIPNVNTLIVEDADQLGLAQLHQIRGRVGRSTRRAYAYLTYRRGRVLSEVSTRRLSAMREFAGFGAGFKIALRDLEIRGAGNILGSEQSGHMMSVGYDMYLKLLEEAVLEERGEAAVPRCETTADLRVSAGIPEGYLSDSGERMDLYRRIALIHDEEDASDMIDELIDRCGDPPKPVLNLIDIALLRAEAAALSITEIQQRKDHLSLTFQKPDVERIMKLCSNREMHGRLLLNAGEKPYITYRLQTGDDPLKTAKMLVNAYKKG